MEQSLPILRNLLAVSELTKRTVVRIISHWVLIVKLWFSQIQSRSTNPYIMKWFSFKLSNNHSY